MTATTGTAATAADAKGGRRRPPLWSIELLDVLDRRGAVALWAAGVLASSALLLATIAPGALRPTALVGLLVGAAALAAGIAIATALDALDVRIRGPRHVRSSGGDLVALLPAGVRSSDAGELAAAVMEARPRGSAMHLGLAPVGAEPDATVAWARALAEALAVSGTSVLLVDLTRPVPGRPGVLEVVRDRIPLADVVTYAQGALLAEVGPGADLAAAIGAVVSLPTLLPDDVAVLLVALPQVSTRAVVNAARVLDQVLLVAEANLTSRVELIASLDALRIAGCAPQVVLVDGATYERIRPGVDVAPPRPRPTSPLPSLDLDVTAVPVAVPIPVPVAPPVPVPIPARPVAPPPVAVPVASPPVLDDEASAPLRTVEVLDAAARARAEAILEVSRLDTVPLDEAEVRSHLAPMAPAARVEVATDDEPTSELPRATPPVAAPSAAAPSAVTPPAPAAPREASVPDWASAEDEEDLLRTTVQLSAFEDELELRDDRG